MRGKNYSKILSKRKDRKSKKYNHLSLYNKLVIEMQIRRSLSRGNKHPRMRYNKIEVCPDVIRDYVKSKGYEIYYEGYNYTDFSPKLEEE